MFKLKCLEQLNRPVTYTGTVTAELPGETVFQKPSAYSLDTLKMLMTHAGSITFTGVSLLPEQEAEGTTILLETGSIGTEISPVIPESGTDDTEEATQVLPVVSISNEEAYEIQIENIGSKDEVSVVQNNKRKVEELLKDLSNGGLGLLDSSSSGEGDEVKKGKKQRTASKKNTRKASSATGNTTKATMTRENRKGSITTGNTRKASITTANTGKASKNEQYILKAVDWNRRKKVRGKEYVKVQWIGWEGWFDNLVKDTPHVVADY